MRSLSCTLFATCVSHFFYRETTHQRSPPGAFGNLQNAPALAWEIPGASRTWLHGLVGSSCATGGLVTLVGGILLRHWGLGYIGWSRLVSRVNLFGVAPLEGDVMRRWPSRCSSWLARRSLCRGVGGVAVRSRRRSWGSS